MSIAGSTTALLTLLHGRRLVGVAVGWFALVLFTGIGPALSLYDEWEPVSSMGAVERAMIAALPLVVLAITSFAREVSAQLRMDPLCSRLPDFARRMDRAVWMLGGIVGALLACLSAITSDHLPLTTASLLAATGVLTGVLIVQVRSVWFLVLSCVALGAAAPALAVHPDRHLVERGVALALVVCAGLLFRRCGMSVDTRRVPSLFITGSLLRGGSMGRDREVVHGELPVPSLVDSTKAWARAARFELHEGEQPSLLLRTAIAIPILLAIVLSARSLFGWFAGESAGLDAEAIGATILGFMAWSPDGRSAFEIAWLQVFVTTIYVGLHGTLFQDTILRPLSRRERAQVVLRIQLSVLLKSCVAWACWGAAFFGIGLTLTNGPRPSSLPGFVVAGAFTLAATPTLLALANVVDRRFEGLGKEGARLIGICAGLGGIGATIARGWTPSLGEDALALVGACSVLAALGWIAWRASLRRSLRLRPIS